MAVEPQAAPAAGDPSMEDILASIRRILNEDEQPPEGTPTPATTPQPPPPAPAAAPAAAPTPDAEPLLALTEDMIIEAPVAPVAPPPPPPAPRRDPEPDPEPMAMPVAEALLAPAATAAAAASVSHLLRTVAAERSSAVYRGGPTIEDVVREEIRPLLKDWLDQYLPPLVERLVQAEIERVVGRAIR